jgi:hypothetical protein
MTDTLPPLPFAVFDEFGIGADDRVRDYALACVLAETKRLRSELAKCGKDNCMGRLSRDVTNWVTVAARDAAVEAERERCAQLCDSNAYEVGAALAAMIRTG